MHTNTSKNGVEARAAYTEARASEVAVMTYLDTPEQLAFFAVLQVKARLKIELATGLLYGRGPTSLQLANRLREKYDPNHRAFLRKTDALEWLTHITTQKGETT